MARDGLLIGEVASRSGLSRKALRLYEARSILPATRRSKSGYRVYPDDVLGTLGFVARARRLGLTLSEIAEITVKRRDGGTGLVADEPSASCRRLSAHRRQRR
jgi:MerR family transcriptional regulator, copper efflux regulator